MSERDSTVERVQELVRTETRRAYLGDPEFVRCLDCGLLIKPDDGYSALTEDGARGYVCGPCNLEDER